jgi:hypothetical protein
MRGGDQTNAAEPMKPLQEHFPTQPKWDCRDCGHRWPCPVRRGRLIAEAETSLATVMLFLTVCFEQALQDRPDADVASLHEQFLGWMDDAVPAP